MGWLLKPSLGILTDASSPPGDLSPLGPRHPGIAKHSRKCRFPTLYLGDSLLWNVPKHLKYELTQNILPRININSLGIWVRCCRRGNAMSNSLRLKNLKSDEVCTEIFYNNLAMQSGLHATHNDCGSLSERNFLHATQSLRELQQENKTLNNKHKMSVNKKMVRAKMCS